MSNKTLMSEFSDLSDRWAETLFIRDAKGNEFSYSKAREKVVSLANYFHSLGVRRWDRVIIISSNHILMPISLYAINALGAIAVIINDQTLYATLKIIVDEVEPTLILCQKELHEKYKLLANCPSVILDDLFLVKNETEVGWRNFIGCSGDPALMIYTSGSTGKPKGVVLSNDNIIFVTEKIQARLTYQPTDIVGLFLPLSFDYGLYQMFLAVLSGACLFLSDASCAGPALAMTLKNNNISVFPGVPHLYGILVQFLNRKKMNLSTIRLCTNTGAHLAATQIQQLKEYLPCAKIAAMYGLTECKRVSILSPDELEQKPGSVGRALDDTDVFIVDDNGKILQPNEIGELVIIGRHLALGYWRSVAETTLRYREHPCGIGRALYSGDNFRMDADGYLYYVGRRDEQIKRNGFRINRLEIENVALSMTGIQNACLLEHNSKLTLFIEFCEDPINIVDIMKYLAANLESYKVPDLIEVLDQFPVSNNGKINRKAIEMSLV